MPKYRTTVLGDDTSYLICPQGYHIDAKNSSLTCVKGECNSDIKNNLVKSCDGLTSCNVKNNNIGYSGATLSIDYACVEDIGKTLMDKHKEDQSTDSEATVNLIKDQGQEKEGGQDKEKEKQQKPTNMNMDMPTPSSISISYPTVDLSQKIISRLTSPFVKGFYLNKNLAIFFSFVFIIVLIIGILYYLIKPTQKI